jgi:hypothetical protein
MTIRRGKPSGPTRAARPAAQRPRSRESDIVAQLKEADERAHGEPDPRLRDELDQIMRMGFSRSIIVALARGMTVLLPGRVTGVKVAVSVLAAGTWPYALNLILLGWAPALAFHSRPSHVYALATTVTCVAMLALSWTAWQHSLGLTAPLADLLRVSPERDSITSWLRGRLSIPRQLVCCLAGVGVALLLMYTTGHQRHSPIKVSPTLYLLLAWGGLLGGNVVYWLYTVAELPLRLRRCTGLQLAWIDPAHTPAVVRLCRTYTLIAGSMAVGVIVTEASALLVSGEHPPWLFIWGFPVFAAATAFYVGAQPFVSLSAMVRRHIDEIMDPLMAQMTRPPPGLLRHGELEDLFKVYTRFRTLRMLPIRTGAVLQYITGILGTLIVYFVQQAVK